MFKRLMILGGILNTLSFFLHVLLGYQIHQLSELSEAHRSLLGAFNIGGSLCIFFFAYVSFFQQKDLLETKLGHAVLALATLLYTVRALEELVLFKFDWEGALRRATATAGRGAQAPPGS